MISLSSDIPVSKISSVPVYDASSFGKECGHFFSPWVISGSTRVENQAPSGLQVCLGS